jgi:hypothetical protein
MSAAIIVDLSQHGFEPLSSLPEPFGATCKFWFSSKPTLEMPSPVFSTAKQRRSPSVLTRHIDHHGAAYRMTFAVLGDALTVDSTNTMFILILQ